MKIDLTKMDDQWRERNPEDATALLELGVLMNASSSVNDCRRVLLLLAQHFAAHQIYPSLTALVLQAINEKHNTFRVPIEEIYQLLAVTYGGDNPAVKVLISSKMRL